MATKKKTKVEETKVKKTTKKATKKKDSITLDMPGTIGSAKLVFPETKVVKGSHLTITYTNGYPEKLEWDDEALMRDVRQALLKAESTIQTTAESKPKRTKKVK
jgi:hypothetical protein